jgi:RNase H-fold protein (predicted Holliday junction resolvase)
VFTVDESYTSVDADQFLVINRVKREKRKELIDMLAAQLILEDFFATTLKKKERRD